MKSKEDLKDVFLGLTKAYTLIPKASRLLGQVMPALDYTMTKATKAKLKLPDPNHVLGCIEKWRSLDLRKKSDSEVDAELSTFLDSLQTFSLSTISKSFFKLWRVRKFNYFIKDVAECWEPPKNATPMGRCNAKGQPVLYVAKKLKTPFEELLIKPREQVYVIQYKQKESLNLRKIVSEKLIPTDLENKPIYDESSYISYQILREFVRSEFLKPVGVGTEYLHRISGSMCRVWFDEDDIEGWLYPSVQSSSDLNIAIKTEVAHNKLEIEDLRIVKIVDKEEVRNSGRIPDKSLPIFNLIKMVIQSDFIGEIKEGKIIWQPTNDLFGDF